MTVTSPKKRRVELIMIRKRKEKKAPILCTGTVQSYSPNSLMKTHLLFMTTLGRCVQEYLSTRSSFVRIKTLRKPETLFKYEERIKAGTLPKCFFCSAKSLKEYKYWKVVENEFPYDEIASESHIISPRRHVTETGLTKKEIEEYKKIKMELNEKYDITVENSPKLKSIPMHYHLHLLILKERIVETKRDNKIAIFNTQKQIPVSE